MPVRMARALSSPFPAPARRSKNEGHLLLLRLYFPQFDIVNTFRFEVVSILSSDSENIRLRSWLSSPPLFPRFPQRSRQANPPFAGGRPNHVTFAFGKERTEVAAKHGNTYPKTNITLCMDNHLFTNHAISFFQM